MGPIKAAVADAAITFLWVFSSSTIGALTFVIASALNAHHLSLLITVSLFAIHLFIFDIIGGALGGASFNPTGNAAFYAAGLPGDTLLSMALRFPAQAAGAVGGALAIAEFVPGKYRHLVGGPSLMVDVHTGAGVEVVLTFVITLVVFLISFKGPRSPMVKALMIAGSIVGLIVAGGRYTGPSMNPANAYGWAYVNNRHNTWEQLYVYWICPFVGAILAAWVFRILFPLPAPKVKAKKV